MSEEEDIDDIILEELSDEELVLQMHDDLYDGLKEEIEEGVHIFLKRDWAPYDILTKVLVEGMRIVGIDFRDGILFVPEVLLGEGYHIALHTKVANHQRKPNKPKKPKGPSQKHSKTIEFSQKNQKNQRSGQLWDG